MSVIFQLYQQSKFIIRWLNLFLIRKTVIYFTLQLDYIININECVLLLQAYYSCLREIHFLFLEDDFRETSASNRLYAYQF